MHVMKSKNLPVKLPCGGNDVDEILWVVTVLPPQRKSRPEILFKVRVEVEREERVYDLKEKMIQTKEMNCFIQTDQEVFVRVPNTQTHLFISHYLQAEASQFL